MSTTKPVRAPEDHKKATLPTKKVDGGYEVTGEKITVFIEEDALDDFELLEDLAELQNGKGSRLPSVARRLFGDQHKNVMDAMRGENGRVSVQPVTQFINDVFAAINPNS